MKYRKVPSKESPSLTLEYIIKSHLPITRFYFMTATVKFSFYNSCKKNRVRKSSKCSEILSFAVTILIFVKEISAT